MCVLTTDKEADDPKRLDAKIMGDDVKKILGEICAVEKLPVLFVYFKRINHLFLEG